MSWGRNGGWLPLRKSSKQPGVPVSSSLLFLPGDGVGVRRPEVCGHYTGRRISSKKNDASRGAPPRCQKGRPCWMRLRFSWIGNYTASTRDATDPDHIHKHRSTKFGFPVPARHPAFRFLRPRPLFLAISPLCSCTPVISNHDSGSHHIFRGGES